MLDEEVDLYIDVVVTCAGRHRHRCRHRHRRRHKT